MSNNISARSIAALAESLDLPDASYEAARRRYHDLGEWLHDGSKSKCAQYDPEVLPQGSFRLGTAIKPWKREEYDLDLVCRLENGITTGNRSQEQLKILLGDDLERYRSERGIHDDLEEKHRCWRLNYQDTLKFHMDTVPSIPHESTMRQLLEERMIKTGSTEVFAHDVAQLALAITDDRHPRYRQITPDWLISNPEGYAKWFEARMRQAQKLLESRAMMEKVARVDDLPTYRWKTPLQSVVQILKRHRDMMFEKKPDSKPISIIITTLAGRAYGGEPDVHSALDAILSTMGSLVSQSNPRVPNPVNPSEDFADGWGTPKGLSLQLEKNFYLWLTQTKADFEIFSSAEDRDSLKEQGMQKFGVALDDRTLSGLFGATTAAPSAPRVQHISGAAKPWHG